RRIRSKSLHAYEDNKANGEIIPARARTSMNRHRGPVQDRHGLARGADRRSVIYATAQGPYHPLLPALLAVQGTVADFVCRPGARPGQVAASRAPVSVMPGHRSLLRRVLRCSRATTVPRHSSIGSNAIGYDAPWWRRGPISRTPWSWRVSGR